MYSSNAFNVLRIANILNLVRKTKDEKLRKNIVAQVNYNEEKKSIKIASNVQKIMQRDNALSYY